MTNCSICGSVYCTCAIQVVPQSPIVVTVTPTTTSPTNPSTIVVGPGQGGAVGAQGIQGVQGTQGSKGTQGLQGTTGSIGAQGIQGTVGTQGLYGVQGTTGTTGAQGLQGVQGNQGTQGTQGTFGTQGTTGSQGTQGLQGTTGIQGTIGIQGTTGTQGLNGTQGTTGTQGAIGTQGTTGAQGTQGTTGSQGVTGIQGALGTQGVQGNTGTSGSSSSYFDYKITTANTSGDPATSNIGYNNATQISSTQLRVSDTTSLTVNIDALLSTIKVNDTLIIQDKTVQTAYQKWLVTGSVTDNTTYWAVPVSLVTSSGTGTTNFANSAAVILIVQSAGIQGTTGTQGAIGTQGTAGLQGLQGTSGSQGTTGTQGALGAQGTTGTQGTVGTQGTTGTQGLVGPQGTTGTQGVDGSAIQGTTNTFTAANTFAPISNAVVPVTVKGAASQTANLQEWQNSSGTSLSSISNTGAITALSFTAGNLSISNGSALLATNGGTIIRNTDGLTIPLRVRGIVSTQVGDFQQFQNSANTVLSGVNAAGQIYAGTSSSSVTTGIATFALTGASIAFTSTTATYTFAATITSAVNPVVPGQTVVITGMSPAGYNGTFVVQSTGGSSGAWTFTVANATNTTATVATGVIKASPSAGLTSPTPYTAGLVVQAAASQIANTIDVQSSTGGALFYVSNGGSVYSAGNYIVPGVIFGNAQNGSQLRFNNNTNNTLNVASVLVRGGGTNQLPLQIQAAVNTGYAITGATANGTTIVYNSVLSAYVVNGQTVTVTGIVSTGNPSGTAGTGFNVTNATVTAVSGSTFTVTVALTDTYTSGGSFIVTNAIPDLTQWLNSSGTVLSKMDSAGALTASALFTSGQLTAQNINLGSAFRGSNANGTYLSMFNNTANTLNSGYAKITSLASNQLPLIIQQASLSSGSITSATANGTTIVYTSTVSANIVVGQTVNVTGIVSTGNPSATAGSGFNVTGASVTAATSTTFTVTVALTDTYTSGGTVTVAGGSTPDITQWQNSAGTVIAKLDSLGNLSTNRFTFENNIWHLSKDNKERFYFSTSSDSVYRSPASHLFRNNSDVTVFTISATGQSLINPTTAATTGLIVKGAASQSANLQEWQNSGGGVLAAVLTSGYILTAGLTDVAGNGAYLATGPSSPITINTRTASITGLVVKGVASQTANLQEWQFSTGGIAARVDSVGNFYAGNLRAAESVTSLIGWTSSYFQRDVNTGIVELILQNYSGAGFQITTGNAASKPFVIKAAASQTADLTQWQDSTGAVLAKVTSAGQLQAVLIDGGSA